MKPSIILFFAIVSFSAFAQQKNNVVCTYAPSQSNLVAGISGAVGGAAVTSSAIGSALGLTVVTHSSGAAILTGSSGYIAGTIGAAGAAPAIVTVGLLVGGVAVSVEVICATENHPEQVAKIQAASEEFSRRFTEAWQKTKIAVGEKRKSLVPATEKTAVKVRQVATNAWEYASRRSTELSSRFLF
jgi:hypothetical protein